MKVRGLSDSLLLKLHREAVRKLFNNACFFCGKTGQLEAHHLIKKKNLLLRYDWRNGVLVCKYGCHAYAETMQGRHLLDKLIEPYRDYLQERSGSCKQLFVDKGITRNEYLQDVKKELEEILKGDHNV